MHYLDQLKKERIERDATRQQNLHELVARYGSIRALAIAISRSPNQIGEMLNGRRPFGDTVARHIEETLDLEPGYLDKEVKKKVNLRPLSKEEHKTTRIPLLSTVQAGLPTDHGDLCYDESIEVFGSLPDGCYALKVTGDSMSPLIDHGDIVVVDPNRWPRPGDYIVARSELENLAEATVKRYTPIGFDADGREIFEARPLNALYPPMHSVQQKLRIIGTVCKLLKDL